MKDCLRVATSIFWQKKNRAQCRSNGEQSALKYKFKISDLLRERMCRKIIMGKYKLQRQNHASGRRGFRKYFRLLLIVVGSKEGIGTNSRGVLLTP
jgi:hypothetical protein